MALSISIEERFSDGAGDEAGDEAGAAAAGADACETTLWPVLIVAGGGGGTALVKLVKLVSLTAEAESDSLSRNNF